MNKKIIENIIDYTIHNYTLKCRSSQYYVNQFLKNRENFMSEPPYNKYEPPGRGEFELMQDKAQKEVSFTEDEYDYVVDYCDEGYVRVNGMLWDTESFHEAIDKGWLIPSDIKYYENEEKNLKSAIEKAPRLTQDTILYHGGMKFDSNIKEGDIGVWKGFTSTSYDEEVADIFTDKNEGDFFVKVYAPQGTKGILVNGQFEPTGEHEFILNEKQRYYVLNVDSENHEIEVLLLPDNYRRGYA